MMNKLASGSDRELIDFLIDNALCMSNDGKYWYQAPPPRQLWKFLGELVQEDKHYIPEEELVFRDLR